MSEVGLQRQYILDAGALIALERRDARMFALLDEASSERIELVLPSAVLAQVWRDGSKQALLARALKNPGMLEAPLHHGEAKQVGLLLCSSKTTDVVDAHVALLADRLAAPVITSDAGDLKRLDPNLDLIEI
jgi:hypothetical protein